MHKSDDVYLAASDTIYYHVYDKVNAKNYAANLIVHYNNKIIIRLDSFKRYSESAVFFTGHGCCHVCLADLFPPRLTSSRLTMS